MSNEILNIFSQFCVQGRLINEYPFGNGHINVTKRLIIDDNGAEREYILQRINTNVFKDPDALMENYMGVTRFLRRKVQLLDR